MRVIRKFDVEAFNLEDYINLKRLDNLHDTILRAEQNISTKDIKEKWFNTYRGEYALLTEKQKEEYVSTVTYKLSLIAGKIEQILEAKDLHDLEDKCDSLTESFDDLLELLEEYVAPHSSIYRYITPYAKEPLC